MYGNQPLHACVRPCLRVRVACPRVGSNVCRVCPLMCLIDLPSDLTYAMMTS